MKKIALAILPALAVALLDHHIYEAKTNKLHAQYIEGGIKQGMANWRRGFIQGFDDCNRRLHYPIDRKDYPKFD